MLGAAGADRTTAADAPEGGALPGSPRVALRFDVAAGRGLSAHGMTTAVRRTPRAAPCRDWGCRPGRRVRLCCHRGERRHPECTEPVVDHLQGVATQFDLNRLRAFPHEH
jgi:hypothetical protein